MNKTIWAFLSISLCIIYFHQGFGMELSKLVSRDTLGAKDISSENEEAYWPMFKGIYGILRDSVTWVNTTVRKSVGSVVTMMTSKPSPDISGSDIPFATDIAKFLDLFRIFPGTKWCGDGDVAKNDNDLGLFALTDACCRKHDKCPYGILAGESKFGLQNIGLFSRSLCSCDDEFYNCLKMADSLISTKIGNFYFNILGPSCFQNVNCKVSKCRDSSQETEYQWRESARF